MKAIIETKDNTYIIRIYGSDGLLCDAYVVENIYFSEEGMNTEKTMKTLNNNLLYSLVQWNNLKK